MNIKGHKQMLLDLIIVDNAFFVCVRSCGFERILIGVMAFPIVMKATSICFVDVGHTARIFLNVSFHPTQYFPDLTTNFNLAFKAP